MSNAARHLLEEALRLPLQERAELAAELLASVDGEPDADVDAAWAAEIERRARRVIAGESEGRRGRTSAAQGASVWQFAHEWRGGNSIGAETGSVRNALMSTPSFARSKTRDCP